MHNDGEIVRAAMPCHPTRVNDTAPVDRWVLDILDLAGEERLREITREIKTRCTTVSG